MNILLNFGLENQHKLQYNRNWFWGTEKLVLDGEVIKKRDITSASNWVSFPLCRRYKYTFDDIDKTEFILEKERPFLLAGIRPHKYRVLVNDELIHEQEGY